jgi:hypothetical protein
MPGQAGRTSLADYISPARLCPVSANTPAADTTCITALRTAGRSSVNRVTYCRQEQGSKAAATIAELASSCKGSFVTRRWREVDSNSQSPHHHAARKAVLARHRAAVPLTLLASGTRSACVVTASTARRSRRFTLVARCGGSGASAANGSISNGCASSFPRRNLTWPDRRSRKRCRGPP